MCKSNKLVLNEDDLINQNVCLHLVSLAPPCVQSWVLQAETGLPHRKTMKCLESWFFLHRDTSATRWRIHGPPQHLNSLSHFSVSRRQGKGVVRSVVKMLNPNKHKGSDVWGPSGLLRHAWIITKHEFKTKIKPRGSVPGVKQLFIQCNFLMCDTWQRIVELRQ